MPTSRGENDSHWNVWVKACLGSGVVSSEVVVLRYARRDRGREREGGREWRERELVE